MHLVLSKGVEIICILSLGFFVYGSTLVFLGYVVENLYFYIICNYIS